MSMSGPSTPGGRACENDNGPSRLSVYLKPRPHCGSTAGCVLRKFLLILALELLEAVRDLFAVEVRAEVIQEGVPAGGEPGGIRRFDTDVGEFQPASAAVRTQSPLHQGVSPRID